jgi:hypothetical protein
MTKKSQPLQGIMKTSEYDDAVSFRVACDCHDNLHDVDVWIEVERDDEIHEITVTFYRELDTPFWETGFNRFREAWNILVHGRSRFSGSLIMRAEAADSLCSAIQTSIARLRSQ